MLTTSICIRSDLLYSYVRLWYIRTKLLKFVDFSMVEFIHVNKYITTFRGQIVSCAWVCFLRCFWKVICLVFRL